MIFRVVIILLLSLATTLNSAAQFSITVDGGVNLNDLVEHIPSGLQSEKEPFSVLMLILDFTLEQPPILR